MKKLLKIAVSLLMMVTSFNTVIAEDVKNDASDDYEIVNIYEDAEKDETAADTFFINEYLAIVDEYESAMVDSSADSEETIMLRKLLDEYPKYIYGLQDYSDEELGDLNFSDEQIAAIRNYDGSASMTAAASPTVSGTLYTPSRSYSSSTNKTTIIARASVQWSGTPFVLGIDTLSISLVGSSASFIRSSSYCYIQHPNGTNVYSSSMSECVGTGVSYKFGITNDSTHVFTKATISYTAVAQGNVTVYGYGAAYAHHTVSNGDSFGISLTYGWPSISFNISSGFVKMWEATGSVT